MHSPFSVVKGASILAWVAKCFLCDKLESNLDLLGFFLLYYSTFRSLFGFDALISLQISSNVPAQQSVFLHFLQLLFAFVFGYKSFRTVMWNPSRAFTL